MMQIKLITSEGEWDVTSPESRVRASPDQVMWGAPPSRVGEEARIGLPGAYVTGRRHSVRTIMMPIMLWGDNLAQLARDFVRSVDPSRDVAETDGQITIQVDTDDGVSRQIDCHVTAGIDSISVGDCHAVQVETVLECRCTQPYWRSTVPVTVAVSPPEATWNETAMGYNEPLSYNEALPYVGIVGVDGSNLGYNEPLSYNEPLPYSGWSSGGVVQIPITNNGDVTAWPKIVAAGQVDGRISLARLDTGDSWSWPDGLDADDELVVGTEPGLGTVLLNGEFAAGGLADGAVLFGLPSRKTVNVVFEMQNRQPGSTLTVEFEERYLTC